MKSWRMGREASAFRFLVLPLVAILAVFVMAGCDGAAVGGNGQPEPAIETSPEAARTFVEKVVATGEEGADGDEVTLAVTQEEVSSFLDLASRVARVAAAQGADSLSDVERMDPATLPEGAEELPELLAMLRAEGNLPDVELPDLEFWSRIVEPRVRFEGDGEMVVTGRVDLLGFQQPVRIVAVPRPDAALDKGQEHPVAFGPVPLPTWLANQLVTNVDALLVMGQDYASVSDVTVTEGELSVTGRLAE